MKLDGVIFAEQSDDDWAPAPGSAAGRLRKKNPKTGRWMYKNASKSEDKPSEKEPKSKKAPAKKSEKSTSPRQPRRRDSDGGISKEYDRQKKISDTHEKLKEVKKHVEEHSSKHSSKSMSHTIARDHGREKAMNKLHSLKMDEMRHGDLKKIAKDHGVKGHSKMGKADLVKKIHQSVVSAYDKHE